MSGEAPAPQQLSPDVAARPIVLAMALAFAAALTVMTLLALAFWYNLGSFPTDMSEQATQDFPAPRLQIVPSLDLHRSRESGEAALTRQARVPIAEAMRLVAARPDPYAPLIADTEVPDDAGRRAMRAQTTQRPAGSRSFDAGARTGAMSPAAEGGPPPSLPGLSTDKTRVPAETLQGTPNYVPLPNENSGVER
ncbi:hypothetical protein [Aurantimonas sp. 22II-16-19i]|uniref:hypothetical protein n=1 Tax=Aurantimonas sp. 22II-16-19i TaxID=1317114 RepID=UPI0009F7ADE9|nr:hypothetical protein [Aurantimonas sp. 22II-16-19i]ORE98884.1 hypothetical protein ATO4_00920 [Aurantimonas sp. 22II-16-19i]